MEVHLPYVHRSVEERKEIQNDGFEGFTAVELKVPFFRGHDFVPVENPIPGF